MNELECKIISTAKFWFEQGWYTVAELEAFIEHNKRMNDHLRKSVEPVEEDK
jgi:hypothetical protein